MKIAVIQISSVLDPIVNLEKIDKFIKLAKVDGADTVFLPEVFYSISGPSKPTPYLVEKDNEHYRAIQSLASRNKVFLLGGSAASKLDDKIINRLYNFDPHGTELSHYDKIHLFSCDLSRHDSKQVIDEADVYTAGNEMKILTIDSWKIGLSLCFDLRFPEMYRDYAKHGCNILTASSAFTRPTGKAHWHTLTRARAIENQAYMIACNQVGDHNEKVKTFGHTTVIDPWGDVLIDMKEEEGFATCELSLKRVQEIRKRMNVFS
jgi:predicted amidohydrolase